MSELKKYLTAAFVSYDGDPPDTDFQRGYLEALKELHRVAQADGWLEPVVEVVANISGGVLQGASSTHPANIITLDFDLDTFDEDATGVMVEGAQAYRSIEPAKVDPDFVRAVGEAPLIYFATGDPAEDE